LSELDRRTAAARSELDTVQRRRDGIVSQLAALRDLVAGFGPDEGDPQPPANAGEQVPQPEQTQVQPQYVQ
jgi:hypothetical protein